MSIRIISDWSAAEHEIDRIANMPNRRMKRRLDDVLHRGFERTQAVVHEETTSLKQSGSVESEIHHADHEWEGTIGYGGDSNGPNNPVDYAIYEKRRGVGGAGGASDAKGDHDFMRPLDAIGPEFEAAIAMGLKP